MVAVLLVTCDGQPLPAAFELHSAEVVREVGRIPHARLVLGDTPHGDEPFPALDHAGFTPGAALAVAVRVDDVTTELFAGLVVRVRLEIAGGAPRLVVEAKDKAWRLTRPRRSAVYAEMTDADAIGAILSRTGVASGALGGDAPAHPALVQHDASDWDFILARAAANGLAVTVRDGELAMTAWSLDAPPALSLTLGLDEIGAVELELDAAEQHPDIEALAWDLPKLALTDAAAATALRLAQGDADPVAIADALGIEAATLAHPVPLPAAELRAWATGRLARDRLAMLRGRISIGGQDLNPLDLIELAGVGARFAGKALVSGVRHSIEDNGWSTDLQLGLPHAPLAPAAVPSDPAGGLLPAARGLTIGLVHDFRDDPEGEQRVSVVLPGVTGDSPLWARLATPEAGNGRGFLFRPAPGDEVVVGFVGDDPRHPIVLGALFGGKNAPPDAFADATGENIPKGFATAKGAALAITDQDKPIVELKTPAGGLKLDDDAGTVTLSDEHGNTLTFEAAGVTLKTAGDLTLEAGGKVVVKGASVALN